MAEARTDGTKEPEAGGGALPAPRSASPASRALWWWVAPVLLIHLVALYSPGSPGLPEPPYVDKVVHAALFGVPTWLLGRLTGRPWLIAAIFAVHAVFSEVAQYLWVPRRDGDVFDALADLVGIAAALIWLLRSKGNN